MEIIEWVKFIVGVSFLLVGIAIFFIEIFGVYRFNYVLNRMHAAAMGDTLGIGFSIIGLIIICGFNFTSLKLFCVVLFLWFASPVSSHLIARLEVETSPYLDKYETIDNRRKDAEAAPETKTDAAAKEEE